MREIKFRVWHKPSKTMFEWEKVKVNHFKIIDDDQLVVMQYTGLKDKNGREIYEGDILKIDDDWEKWGFASGFVGYVIYDQGSFKLKEGEIYAPAYRLDSAAEEGTTVIGNIFQDGDLLRDS